MRWLAAIFAALLLVGCTGGIDKGATASYFGSISNAQWLYSEPVEFEVDSLPDSLCRGRLAISLRHSAVYPYRNIWLEVKQSGVGCDTFEVMLADPFGRWYGTGMGASLRRTDTVAAHYTLAKGTSLSVRHIMRVDTLDGVEQIGLMLLP